MSRDTYPRYSKSRVDKAGYAVRNGVPSFDDVKIIENWRASHNHVLNSWQSTLRNRVKKSDFKIVFAQRLKRKNTIFDKLSRQDGMKLSRMHDVAGCRLIFKTIEDLHSFRDNFHMARMDHKRRKADQEPYPYNYIELPKSSGYRGIHDVYTYRARKGRSSDWDGLMVEIQYRTILQHAWATAVEVAGTFTGNFSKFGQGDKEQLEFFRLASEIIARAHESRFSCKKDLSNTELIKQFQEKEYELELLKRLDKLRAVEKELGFNKKKSVYILFQPRDDTDIVVYTYNNLPEATRNYFELENNHKYADIVLVRAASQESIKSAFQNYFSDAQDFVGLINSGLKKLSSLG